MIFGYARVSTTHQNLDMQKDELTKYGVDEIITDVISGTKVNREGLDSLLIKLRKDDILVVYKLDRLGRTMHQLVNLINEFKVSGVNFVSIKDGIDTSTITGRFMFNIMGAVAEMEREVINERVNTGLASAKARGRNGGRKKVNDNSKINIALNMLKDGYSKKEVTEATGITRTTLYRYIKESQDN